MQGARGSNPLTSTTEIQAVAAKTCGNGLFPFLLCGLEPPVLFFGFRDTEDYGENRFRMNGSDGNAFPAGSGLRRVAEALY